MATGEEEPTVSSNANVPAKVTEEKDRFQEGKTEEHRNISQQLHWNKNRNLVNILLFNILIFMYWFNIIRFLSLIIKSLFPASIYFLIS